jgi:hypothetical protein
MFWHRLRDEDLIACLNIDPARMGAELIGHERAVRVWRELIPSRSLTSAVIECDPPNAGHRIVGFGAAVFVARTFAEAEIANPRPGLNARIIASVASGESVVLNEAQLRAANTEGGLDVVVLYPQWRMELNAEQMLQAQMLLISAFLEEHRGYRLHRLLGEILRETERQYYIEPAGVWRVISEFRDFYLENPDTSWNSGRCLAVVNRQEAFQVYGHITGILFQYREPVLGLSDADQQLLTAALTGLTDEELAHHLSLGLSTVKKRWRSLFERAAAKHSELFPKITADLDAPGRGRQKRHFILAYVRDHPEELRPFDAKAIRRNSRSASAEGAGQS